jgi:AhpD family alkylhydroperoxidase
VLCVPFTSSIHRKVLKAAFELLVDWTQRTPATMSRDCKELVKALERAKVRFFECNSVAESLQQCHAAATLLCYSLPMATERKEPTYLFTEKQVSDKSEIARRFLDTRTRLNANVDRADNFLLKRFYNIDHNTYLEGAIPAKYKELMGLVVSAGLRCDDCINYHIIQSYRLGVGKEEQQEALNVAVVVGGSIVIPHLRRAYELLEELYKA